MDGKIIVWDVREEEPQEVKVLEGIIPAVKDTKYTHESVLFRNYLTIDSGPQNFSMTVQQCGILPANILWSLLALMVRIGWFSQFIKASTHKWTAEVVAISRDTWTKTSTFSDEASIGVTTALAFSPNGVYLASSCNKQILIWSTQTRRMLFTCALFNKRISLRQIDELLQISGYLC